MARTRVEALMGTVASLEVRGDPGAEAAQEAATDEAVDEAFAWLHEVDRRFSPYREDSEVSRYGRGELALDDASAELRDVLRRCEALRLASGGAFDARRWRADGRPDPTGLVKGWAIEEAGLILTAGGVGPWMLNVGGDVLTRGEPEPGEPWLIGIRHPDDASRVAAVLGVRDLAVATSGGYERGDHVIDPRTGAPVPAELRSVTVVGPSMTLADGYATAALVMGRTGVAWVAGFPGYGALAITADGRLLSSDVAHALLVQGTPD